MCGCLCTEIQFPQYLQSIKQSSLFKARMNISVTLGRKLYFILQLLFKHYEIFLILVKVQNEMFQTSANYYRPCLLVEVINYNKKGNQVTLLCWGFFVDIHCFKVCPPLVLSVALSIKALSALIWGRDNKQLNSITVFGCTLCATCQNKDGWF